MSNRDEITLTTNLKFAYAVEAERHVLSGDDHALMHTADGPNGTLLGSTMLVGVMTKGDVEGDMSTLAIGMDAFDAASPVGEEVSDESLSNVVMLWMLLGNRLSDTIKARLATDVDTPSVLDSNQALLATLPFILAQDVALYSRVLDVVYEDMRRQFDATIN